MVVKAKADMNDRTPSCFFYALLSHSRYCVSFNKNSALSTIRGDSNKKTSRTEKQMKNSAKSTVNHVMSTNTGSVTKDSLDLSTHPQINQLLNDVVSRFKNYTVNHVMSTDTGSVAKNLLDLSTHPQINRLLNDVVSRLKSYTEIQTRQLNELTKIGVALSGTRNLDNLLEMILDKARAFTNADGGSLTLIDDDETILYYSIVHNESMDTRLGGASGGPVDKKIFEDIPLYIDGKPNSTKVSAYVATSGKMVNIPDVYEVEGFDFQGPRKFDMATDYRTMSMMVIPMRNHLNEIIGVLQLINAQDFITGETIPFAQEYELLTESLASQAAVALTNARLINDMEELFESFIKTIASAIDEKSSYTGGHIERVAILTMDIAYHINSATTGKYADTHFTDNELEELRLAAWLHDTGKITTPEYVVDKRTKLETIFDREEVVHLRFELAKANIKMKAAEASAGQEHHNLLKAEVRRIRAEAQKELKQLDNDLAFIVGSNFTSEFVPDEKIERLKEIAKQKVEISDGSEPILTENELYNLCIRKGNLTPEERNVINNHAVMTYKLLSQMPFPKRLKNVAFLAGAHHENLNGKGYPNGLKGDQIPLQARILKLADGFEALTSKDRPYQHGKPRKLSGAVKILGFAVKDTELDPDLVQFFLDERIHIEYAKQYLSPFQIDME